MTEAPTLITELDAPDVDAGIYKPTDERVVYVRTAITTLETTGFNLSPEQARELAHRLITAAEIVEQDYEDDRTSSIQTVWRSKA